MTTTTETVGADAHAAAATTDTDHVARLMNATAEDLRVHESLEDERTEEEEAGAERTTGTDRGLAESPEADLAPAPSQPLREKTSTHHQPPITQKKKSIRLTPRPAPDPARHPDPTPIRALGHDPGLDANQEVAKNKRSSPVRSYVSWTLR